jgi:beta-glucosidase
MSEKAIYLDETASVKERAKDLVSKMTLEEKASQLRFNAPAIDRLGVPAYNWWNEALHGVARAGTATVFPQAIALAAIFDDAYLEEIADVIATEARAKYNENVRSGDRDIYKGITMWSPNINIFRDPRWGRGHETYGEDPYLTTRLGVGFIKGLQGKGKHLKVAACAKHFAVHSGPEGLRHEFDAIVSQKDLYETYLPAFEAAVKEAGVEAVMGAYNRTLGEPCCGSKTLLRDILRGKWGFTGHVVSDCWAIMDFHTRHHVTKTAPESAALALKNGCDVNCGSVYLHLLSAVEEGLITEEDIAIAAERLMATRIKLGMFDETCEYNDIPYEANDSREHRNKSLEAARKAMVLLKNNGLLPLDKSSLSSVAVIGPNADSQLMLKGNYFGTPSESVTILEGIREAVGEDVRVYYSEGCHLFQDKVEPLAQKKDRLDEAVSVAKRADVAILCLGMDSNIEGEEGDAGNAAAAGDKADLNLPGLQQELLEKVIATGTPVILILGVGSALAIGYAQEHCAAILNAWYPGSLGGRAAADILFGKCSPGGKLPVTFYRDTAALPAFTDYAMKNRTYRYFEGETLYPFGYGLTYSTVTVGDLSIEGSGKADE